MAKSRRIKIYDDKQKIDLGRRQHMSEKELLEEIIEKEEKYQFDSFSNEDAFEIGLLIKEMAKKYSGPVAVSITVDGLEVFRYFPPTRGKLEEKWIEAKRNLVSLTGTSSLRSVVLIKLYQFPEEPASLIPGDYAFSGGGFPIRLKNGMMIGSIITSGLTSQEDNSIIWDSLEKYFEK
jgi:uncharacterized protein (UPF0303 family)